MRIHIEPIGGLAGDMFVAAMVDANPELADGLGDVLRTLAAPDDLRITITPTKNAQMSGHRFSVSAPSRGHAHYPDIIKLIENSGLDQQVKARAQDIFTILGHAEARVHGVDLDAVHFHEVGNWDSIVDIVLAAYLIEQSGKVLWTAGSLPLGEGFVDCDHGRIPVPAPATMDLLKGFEVHRDGIKGERITPTGAAILRHLAPAQEEDLAAAILDRSGVGFGTREFPQISNVLRLLFFSRHEEDHTADTVGVIRFTVDDQTAEDLAIGLAHLRALDGVLDVTQIPAFGKKGRVVSRIEILCRPSEVQALIDACFRQTTTIGLRWGYEQRVVLPRETRKVIHEGRTWSAKVARRSDGVTTAKAEVDELSERSASHSERNRLRQAIERSALDAAGIKGGDRESSDG